MKKTLALILALVLCFGMLAGCSSSSDTSTADTSSSDTSSADAATALSADIIIATGGTGGSYYPYGGAMAQIISTYVDGVSATATVTGASAENARNLENKEADFAILQNDVLDYAFTGTELMSEGGALTNLATVGSLYPEVVQLVVTLDSGINSVEDLVGKRISVGAAGSGVEANARHILGAYDISYDDFTVNYLGFSESSTGMQNKTLDGAFVTAGIPNSSIMELSAMTDCKLISIDADVIDSLIEEYGFYSAYTIADEDYEGIDGGAETVAVLATLACSADLDEELVYQITKCLFENQAELAAGFAKGADLSVETALSGISVDLHAGALRYYQEIGAID